MPSKNILTFRNLRAHLGPNTIVIKFLKLERVLAEAVLSSSFHMTDASLSKQ
jgi:hypothetical protein